MAEVTNHIEQHLPHNRGAATRRLRQFVPTLLIIAVLFVASWFRLTGLYWDQDRHLHPDERYMTVLASMLKSVPTATEYFNSGDSTLNPFNTDWGRSYVYGTLPLFAGRYFAEFMDSGCGPEPKAVPRLLGQLFFKSDSEGCAPNTFTGYDNMALLGRIWSALTDVLSIAVLYQLGIRLFGRKVALVAAALSSVAVLQIQQAHFFTVDSTASLFVMLAILFCVVIATGKGLWNPRREVGLWLSAIAAGLSAGFGIASKISVWPLIPLIIMSLAIMLARDKRRTLAPLVSAILALFLAGVSTFVSFRIAQPYAFVGNSQSEFLLTFEQCDALGSKDMLGRVCALGAQLPQPIREVFAPSARWIKQLNLAQGFVNGTIDAPFGHQWANRTPIVFPLINLVFWGLGIPLGLSAIFGFLYAATRLLKGRRWWAYILPFTWTGLYFLYQSTQWTKSMRYLLPIYPLLCLFAAIALVAVYQRLKAERKQNGNSRFGGFVTKHAALLGILPLTLVLSGTVIWALAFMQIYTEPITRVTASRWVYDNVPTAITLNWRTASNDVISQQLAIKNIGFDGGSMQIAALRADQRILTQTVDLSVTLNHLDGEGELEVRLLASDAQTVMAAGRGWLSASRPTIILGTINQVDSSQYLLEFTIHSGESLSARASTIANEHWDDAVPQPIDGKDAYGSYYNNLSSSSDGQIQNYMEDVPEKLPQVLDWLDEADFLVLSSNRLYASIPRLPWRFPMASEYYRALLGGKLGFELAADFHSFPRIGSLLFNDQEMPQELKREVTTAGTPPGVQLPYPTAEEAFSVYDHPRVFIYRKTPSYTRENAEQLLGKYDLTQTIKQTPLQALNSPRGMLLDDKSQAAQTSGGTWSELFPRSSPLNESQPLAVVAWLLLIEALGLAVFPIMAVTTSRTTAGVWRPSLADGGYSFSKALALLLVAVMAWWLGSTKVAAFTSVTIWVIMLLIVCAGVAVGLRNRNQITQLLRERLALIITSEVVFVIGFLIFVAIRIGNPDLWHPYMGGEKPMDFAYLNGVLKSTYFPPIDPWFAGGYLNYYYLGFVIVGAPIKALGIDPAVAYNLVIPLLFGLTAMGAFGLSSTLYMRLGNQRTIGTTTHMLRAIITGIIAAVFVVGLGNLRELDVVVPAWQKLGNIESGTNPLSATFDGIVKWINGTPLPVYPNWAYWNPTRPTASSPIDAVQIAEFPLFTFLYADLHAHMMAMPVAFLALAFALAYASGSSRWHAILLGSVVVGALHPINSWDYPVYLLVCVAAFVLHEWDLPKSSGGTWLNRLARILPPVLVFIALTRALYIPYLENYGTAYNSIEPWKQERTPLGIYLSLFGLLLLPAATYLISGIFTNLRRHPLRLGGGILYALLAGALSLVLAAMGVHIAVVAIPLAALALLAALMPSTPSHTRLLWLLAAGACLLTLFVELFTLKGDIGRMNTVFKFYIQTWLILGVTSPVLLIWTLERISAIRKTGTFNTVVHVALKPAFIGCVAFLLLLAVAYPVFAIPAKIHDRYDRSAPTGLDGMVYMTVVERYESINDQGRAFPLRDDYNAIKWMQDHVKGSPVIMEGTTGGNLYRWGNRFSIYTGLPSVIGWQWHQRQQRAALSDQVVYNRDDDVRMFYNTVDTAEALMLLRRYKARYIIVGELERVYYSAVGFQKYPEMVSNGFLREVFTHGGTTVYEVIAAH